MSALGQKQTSELVQSMSALPPKADIETRSRDVRFVPKADSCSAAINGKSPVTRPSLRTPGAPKVLRCLCGSLERCVSILCAHSDSRFDVRQTTAAGGSQDRGSCCFLVREFTNRHPIMMAEGQVPPDEPTAYALEELRNRFLTVFWFRQHALDRVGSVPTTRN